MIKPVKIRSTSPHSAVIEVDGKDIAPMVNAFRLAADLDETALWISFSMAVLPEFDGPAEVEISEDLHEALVHLGWTPPAKGEVGEWEISTLGGPERVFLRSDGTYRKEPWHVPTPPDVTVGHEGSDRWTGGDRKDEP